MESLSQSAPSQSIQATVEANLEKFARFGVDLGLDRIEKLLSDLGNPHHNFPIVHVAGTNGKGSVCAYVASVLSAAGYKTGLYTSPHLVNWTERIRIDKQPISWQDLQSQLQAVEAAIDPTAPDTPNSPNAQTPTQFEVFTAAAWRYFAASEIDVAVVEVGLGGRLDATNVFDQPLATVIVSISRDHWERLGDTLGAIAREKAGILKPGVPALVGPLPPEAETVVRDRATQVGAPLTWVSEAQPVGTSSSTSTSSTDTLTYDSIQYPQVLLGDHQRINSACAIATLQALRAQSWAISDEAIAQGMATVRWPGRLQPYRFQGVDWLIDGAHNQDSARSLRAYLDKTFPQQPITWLMGMLSTKDHPAIFSALLRGGDQLHLVPVPGHLSAAPEQLSAIAQQTCPALSAIHLHKDLEDGLLAATQTHQPQNSPRVFCGSLYLIGQFYERYGNP
jgi:dihydrofolate synthase / folylpolyglutamate synthase